MRTVAERLGYARERAGRSIRSLQQSLHERGVPGSSYANVHAYLKGKTQPSIEFVEAAARELEVRAAWLAFEDGEMTVYQQLAAVTEVGPRLTPEQELAEQVWKAAEDALQNYSFDADLMPAVDVLRDYYRELRAIQDDLPTDRDGINALFSARFPRTVSVAPYVDHLSARAILYSEAAAAFTADALARPSESRAQAAERVEEWRSIPPKSGEDS